MDAVRAGCERQSSLTAETSVKCEHIAVSRINVPRASGVHRGSKMWFYWNVSLFHFLSHLAFLWANFLHELCSYCDLCGKRVPKLQSAQPTEPLWKLPGLPRLSMLGLAWKLQIFLWCGKQMSSLFQERHKSSMWSGFTGKCLFGSVFWSSLSISEPVSFMAVAADRQYDWKDWVNWWASRYSCWATGRGALTLLTLRQRERERGPLPLPNGLSREDFLLNTFRLPINPSN